MAMLHTPCRREFLKTAVAGGLSAAGALYLPAWTSAAEPSPASSPKKTPSRVALATGNDRADNVFQALKPFAEEVARAIGDRRVVIKPNNVVLDNPLAVTNAGCMEGVLEFLKSIDKASQTVIAESPANGSAFDAFDSYGYPPLAKKYGVKMLELDQQPHQVVQVFDETDFRPHPVRMARLLLDRNSYVISAAVMKTHELVISTLSLKNIVVGAAIKDQGWDSDKRTIHGNGIRGINYNLFALAERLHPDLAVIDGYEGMEGDGPTNGSPVQHRVCVASTDWLAADRVAIELMGINFAKIGYLNYCADAGLGEANLKKIEIIGPPIKEHIKTYQLPSNISELLIWMKPV
jgi:uncharacterized protein (DUF362 family)